VFVVTGNKNLERLAKIIAEWAESLPIKRVYIFGSQVRGNAGPSSDLDVAIEFSPTPSEQEIQNWQHQNDTDFACLKGALGIPLSLHADHNDAVWPAIRNGAQAPVLSIGNVYCVITLAKPPDSLMAHNNSPG
jgi:predicted nucleotidyltransferase